MSKILLLRIFNDGTVTALYSDGLSIENLEKLIDWCKTRINRKKSMEPKG